MANVKNALARAQRQFYNEYEKALMDADTPMLDGPQVVDLFLRAQNLIFEEGLKHAV